MQFNSSGHPKKVISFGYQWHRCRKMPLLVSVVFLLTCLSMVQRVGAQAELRYEDEVYLENIKSVKFHHEGLLTSLPIIDLNSGAQLVLSFDDIYGGDRDYSYKVIHCDKDWRPSSIDEMEYIDGFNDERIDGFAYSVGTKMDYTHYVVSLPNRNLTWRLSGNYVLVVRDDDAGELALTRRFMVVEPKVKIAAQAVKAIKASQVNTHQEIDFVVNHKDFYISNPQREIFVTVMQNGNWHRSIQNIQPRVVTGYDLNFERTEQITFPGLKEFRGVDLRSVRSKGYGILQIDNYPDGYEAIVALDRNRNGQSDFDYNDLNGQYLVETLDDNMDDIKAEYVDVLFSLASRDEILDQKVCVVGAFNDWKCKAEYVMSYNYDNQLYNAYVLLKQGYYDYQYVLVGREGVDFEFFEGNSFSTRNEYTILVYLRSYADRYDRLIGVSSFVSDF